MKNSKLKTSDAKVVVIPQTRRGGCDENPKNENKQKSLEEVIGKLNSQELDTISNRILSYTTDTLNEIELLREACEAKEVSRIENAAHRIASLSAEVGAVQMLRLCYQILISSRRGQLTAIPEIIGSLDDEFGRVKQTLRVS